MNAEQKTSIKTYKVRERHERYLREKRQGMPRKPKKTVQSALATELIKKESWWKRLVKKLKIWYD